VIHRMISLSPLQKNHGFQFLIIFLFITLTAGLYDQAYDFSHDCMIGYSNQESDIDNLDKLTCEGCPDYSYLFDKIHIEVHQTVAYHFFAEKSLHPALSLLLPCTHRGPPEIY
jgi:hypothetical protein